MEQELILSENFLPQAEKTVSTATPQVKQARKFLLTINNPLEKGFDHNTIRDILATMNLAYYCMADEMTAGGLFHTHVFIFRKGAIRTSTIQQKFPGVHFDICIGSCVQCRDYVLKQGKYADTAKSETSIPGTFEEVGTLPIEAQENNPSLYDVIADVEAGRSTAEIIKENPKFAFRANDIEILRETLAKDRLMTSMRNVTVHYIYGNTGTGKSRSIFAAHEPKDICRITSYGKNSSGARFDAYHGQAVLVFEEFHGQIPIAEMLNYLDIYPLTLPARYSDRVAAYETVYITSNIPLWGQYIDIQKNRPSVWNALLRRISDVTEFFADGRRIEHPEQLVIVKGKLC